MSDATDNRFYREKQDQPAAEKEVTEMKCWHCNGSGSALVCCGNVDQSDGACCGCPDADECETCFGEGVITTIAQYLQTLPAEWHANSSLETWFPLTAGELKLQKEVIESQARRIAELERENTEQKRREMSAKCARCGHPLFTLSEPPPAARDELIGAMNEANDFCRSAFEIAKRVVEQYGTVTSGVNFGAFKDRLEESLERQHAVMLKHRCFFARPETDTGLLAAHETPAPLPSAWMAADGRVITASAKEAGERVAAAATASSEFSIPLYRGQSNA